MMFRIFEVADQALALEEAYTETAQVIRHNSKTFYLATALLPNPVRRAIRSLYAFCRATDDLVDKAWASLAQVECWRAQANQPAQLQKEPSLLCWADTRETYGVDLRYQNILIDGVAMDLRQNRYATWNELAQYCFRVASTVGLLSIPIIGLAPGVQFHEAAPYAVQLGLALQLTNILRDVGEDAARGRVYLPQTDLARFGLSPDDILNGLHDERFVALMKFEIARARELYEEALPGIALLAPSARLAVGAAALLYRAILDKIESRNYRVHAYRCSTGALEKLWRLPGICWTVLTLRAPQPPRSHSTGQPRLDCP